MFVVGTVQRTVNAEDPSKFDLSWPVVFEDAVNGVALGVIGSRSSREAAEGLSAALNSALENGTK